MYPVWFGKYLCQLHQKKLPWDETIEPFLCFFATRVPDSLLPTPGILWGISSWKDGSGWKLVARQRLKETAQETQSHLTNYKYFLLHGHHTIAATLKEISQKIWRTWGQTNILIQSGIFRFVFALGERGKHAESLMCFFSHQPFLIFLVSSYLAFLKIYFLFWKCYFESNMYIWFDLR